MRILIVTHFFPPLNVVSSLRPYGWAKAWSAQGHEVHILTPAKYAYDGDSNLDLSLESLEVHEVKYLPEWMTRARPETGSTSRSRRWQWAKYATRRIRSALGALGDPRNLAYSPLVRRGQELLAGDRFDFVISTAPPPFVHRVGRTLAGRSRVPWVADYRDHWDYETPPGALRATIRRRIEQRRLRRARLVTTVSKGLASHLELELRRPVAVSYNGYLDGESLENSAKTGIATDTRFHLVYTGRFYPTRRDPRVLLESLARMLRDDPSLSDRFAFDVFGVIEPWLERIVRQLRLDSVVHLHGTVPYAQSISAQQAASALLFVDWHGDGIEGILSGKLFEYLQSGRPIVVIGDREHTEASQIIQECRAGVLLRTAAEVDGFLASPSKKLEQCVPDRACIERFSRTGQARELLSQIGKHIGAS
ncbi:MAG: glycosyltransferase [Betaproteobacteria bacterium]|nr:glycosyltransferase [Betaproteobacteria bacterium]